MTSVIAIKSLADSEAEKSGKEIKRLSFRPKYRRERLP